MTAASRCAAALAHVSRHYLQCAPDEDVNEWPDARFWDELHTRIGDTDRSELIERRILQKGVAPVRSFVAAPMRYGNLFLAGDASHIVPPTGAKGLNLAAADVRVLARALAATTSAPVASDQLDRYSDTCLRRVWKGAALIVVDDVAAAPLRGAQRIRSPGAARRARLHRRARAPR